MKLILSDHFDEIKNQIDIQTETFLSDKNLSESYFKNLNDLRHRKLDKLEQVVRRNLLSKTNPNG